VGGEVFDVDEFLLAFWIAVFGVGAVVEVKVFEEFDEKIVFLRVVGKVGFGDLVLDAVVEGDFEQGFAKLVALQVYFEGADFEPSGCWLRRVCGQGRVFFFED